MTGPQLTDDSQFDLHDYLRIILRGRWIIAFTFLCVLAVTLYLNKTAIPVYESTITLLSEEFRREPAAAMGGGASWGYFVGDKPINNKQVILMSGKMALEVAQYLKRSAERDEASFLRDSYGNWLPDETVAAILQLRIKVTFTKESDIISFTAAGYGANGARDAAIIANAYGDVFYERSFREIKGEIYEVKKFLTDQIENIKIDLEKAEEDLRNFQEQEGLVKLSSETDQLISEVNRLEFSYNDVMTELGTNTKRIAYIQTQLDEQKKNLPEDIARITSPLLTSLRNELAAQEGAYAKFLAQGIPGEHSQMKEIRLKIDDITTKLKQQATNIADKELVDPLQTSRDLVVKIIELNVNIESGRVRADIIKRLQEQYEKKLIALPEKSLQMARLERKTALYSDLYGTLVRKNEEIRIEEAGKMNTIQVVDRARPSRKPIKPKKGKNIMVGILVGLGLGLGITLTIEFLDTSFKSPAEIERVVKLPMLGAIPKIRTQEIPLPGLSSQQESGDVARATRLITHFAPKSPIAEAYRTLRTNIQFIQPDNPIHTIMVTSSNPKEGKSTTIANLAIALAQTDIRTVLIDTDFRRPIVHSMFNIEREPGLTSVLLDQHRLEDVVRRSEINNLSIIPAGLIPPNPSELLGSKKMKEMLEHLKGMFDIILFDSPPVIAVTDAAVLGSEVDGVILVVQEGQTRREDVLRSKELLCNVNANICGVVLNAIDIQKKYGHYYYYYYHYYQDYYTSIDDIKPKKSWWEKRKTSKV